VWGGGVGGGGGGGGSKRLLDAPEKPAGVREGAKDNSFTATNRSKLRA